ncbi:uncharacterized protein LOC121875624 [Homarus americanus]|uniref:Secreted protein n=1 Tax=Homarus americanus TaxID=6706 RepID=A0A8J5JNC5_HOMAM|nr:uncharacterized protein LOC121875624 [Homarus americanus]KAG7160906.1 hypothetical protein Hamer_G007682 [Homarus americanus]
MLRLLLVVVVALLVVDCQAGFTDTTRYQIWAADLKPGFIIESHQIQGQRCYCKVPWASSASLLPPSLPSLSFDPNSVLTSSPSETSSYEQVILSRPESINNTEY